MNAVLLAAGLGTRLRPLTDVLPKCLAPIRGRPLLEYWLRMLFSGEIERILVNTHFGAELVEYYLRRSPWAPRIVIVREMRLLGTGGTLLANREFIGDRPVLVAHADNLSRFDLGAFARAHATRPPGTALTMMTFTTPTPSSCGIVTTDGAGVVTGFYEKVAKPPGNRANGAVFIFEPEVLEFLTKLGREFLEISADVLPHFVGRIATWHNDVYHRDIGTLTSWQEAQRDFPFPPYVPTNPDPWANLLENLSPAQRRTLRDLRVV